MPEGLVIEPLTRDVFAPYGDVIEFAGREHYPINDGMAERYHALAGIEVGGGDGRAVISLLQSKQFEMPRRLDHMEYHPHGSQAFIPLDETPFIIVVAAAGETPREPRAFVTNGSQGVNYRAGTWHHVLLTPFAGMRFVCVDRDSPEGNCVDFHFPEDEQFLLQLP